MARTVQSSGSPGPAPTSETRLENLAVHLGRRRRNHPPRAVEIVGLKLAPMNRDARALDARRNHGSDNRYQRTRGQQPFQLSRSHWSTAHNEDLSAGKLEENGIDHSPAPKRVGA